MGLLPEGGAPGALSSELGLEAGPRALDRCDCFGSLFFDPFRRLRKLPGLCDIS